MSGDEQDEIYDIVLEKLANLEIDDNSIIYIKQANSLNFSENFYLEVYVRENIVQHDTLTIPDFLIFLK